MTTTAITSQEATMTQYTPFQNLVFSLKQGKVIGDKDVLCSKFKVNSDTETVTMSVEVEGKPVAILDACVVYQQRNSKPMARTRFELHPITEVPSPWLESKQMTWFEKGINPRYAANYLKWFLNLENKTPMQLAFEVLKSTRAFDSRADGFNEYDVVSVSMEDDVICAELLLPVPYTENQYLPVTITVKQDVLNDRSQGLINVPAIVFRAEFMGTPPDEQERACFLSGYIRDLDKFAIWNVRNYWMQSLNLNRLERRIMEAAAIATELVEDETEYVQDA